MDVPIVTRSAEALTFTTTPTDTMRFLAPGGPMSLDVYVERRPRATARPCTATRR